MLALIIKQTIWKANTFSSCAVYFNFASFCLFDVCTTARSATLKFVSFRAIWLHLCSFYVLRACFSDLKFTKFIPTAVGLLLQDAVDILLYN